MTENQVITKESIIRTITVFLGLSSDDLKSLDKATKADLMKLEAAIIKTAHIHDNKRK
jgi:hypothetical protein